MRLDRARLADWSPYLVAVAIAVLYVCFAPHTADLAGQTAREELFRRSGFVAFWSGWYAGLPSAEYSLITPPLLGLFGAVWLGALSIVATALIVVPMLRASVRPRLGAIAFVVAASLDVASGRTTFAVGAVVALAAVVAVERRSVPLTVALAALATATSPVAGFLLFVAALTLLLADRSRPQVAIALAAGVAGMLGIVALLSRGTVGYEPFSRVSLLMAVATTAVVGLAPVGARLRVAAGVTIVMLVGVYFVHSPVGANATRIAVLAAAPTLIATAKVSQRMVLVAAGVFAALLPLAQFHNDLSASTADDSSRAFVAPLLAQLSSDPLVKNHRVELVDTATHWPSTYLLPNVELARGWERQVDESRNPMFYGRGPLTARTYRDFLDRYAVGAIAVATGVPLDYGVTREAALLKTGLPYLQLVWSDQHWRLYTVDQPTPIVAAPARVLRLTDTGMTIRVPAAGNYLLRMQWSPYLAVTGGTLVETANNQVELMLTSGGTHELHAIWRLL